MGETAIGWCTHSWNLLKWWCTKVSEGCKNCYMMALAAQYPQHASEGPMLRAGDAAWKELRKFPAGAEVFAGDMYDWLHEKTPDEYIALHLQAFASRPDITFLTLTKRAQRLEHLASFMPGGVWPENLWVGVSVELPKYAGRLDLLRATNAKHKLASVEPLLASPRGMDFKGIDQIITGGESGPNHRPFDPAWGLEARDLCARDGAAFFHKQGGHQYPGRDRLLDGREYNELAWRKPLPVAEQTSLF